MAVLPSAAATIVLIVIGILFMHGRRTNSTTTDVVSTGAWCNNMVDPAVTPFATNLASNLVVQGYSNSAGVKEWQSNVNTTTAVYGKADCQTDSTACGGCLNDLTAKLFNVCPAGTIGGQINSSDCTFRFEIYPFDL